MRQLLVINIEVPRQLLGSNSGPLNSDAKMIPLHKKVFPESAKESPPPQQYLLWFSLKQEIIATICTWHKSGQKGFLPLSINIYLNLKCADNKLCKFYCSVNVSSSEYYFASCSNTVTYSFVNVTAMDLGLLKIDIDQRAAKMFLKRPHVDGFITAVKIME